MDSDVLDLSPQTAPPAAGACAAPAAGEASAPAGAGERVPSRLRTALVLLAAALFILSARLWIVHDYASPIPFWDDWDAIGEDVLRPAIRGDLSVQDLIAPHNEHRMLLTRLLALGLFHANSGQWDPLLHLSANALLHTLSAVLLMGILVRLLHRQRLWWIVLSVVVAWGIPFGWEAATWAVCSQWYFLVLLGLLALWGLILHRPLHPWWILGALSAILACFTLASGMLIGAAVLGIQAYRLLSERRRAHLPSLLVGAAACVAGVVLYSSVEQHESYTAGGIRDFVGALDKTLAWPLSEVDYAGLLVYSPVLGLLAMWLLYRHVPQWFRSAAADTNPTPPPPPASALSTAPDGRPQAVAAPPPRFTELERACLFVLAVGLWMILQAVVLAYGRGADASRPASRYLDAIVPGLVINLMALPLLGRLGSLARLRLRGAVTGWAVVWLVAVTLGLTHESMTAVPGGLALRRASGALQQENCRQFLIRGVPLPELQHTPYTNLPYPVPHVLQSFLQNPHLRRILPPELRSSPIPRPPDPNTAVFRVGAGSTFAGLAGGEEFLGSFHVDPNDDTAAGKPVGTFRGEPIVLDPPLPMVTFQYLGRPEREGLSIRLQPVDGPEVPELPLNGKRSHWQRAYAPAPPGPFRLVVTDERTDEGIGFTWPVGMGRLSWGIRLLLPFTPWLLLGSLAGLLATGRWETARRFVHVRV